MVEKMILNNLLFNEEYLRKVLPFLKEGYFGDRITKATFKLVNEYVEKYNKPPSPTALRIEADSITGMSDEDVHEIKNLVSELKEENNDIEWLVDSTEKFCQDKAVINAITESIHILDDKSGKLSKGSIPQILSEALGVSFDTSIGHDYLDDFEERYDSYHTKVKRVEFDLEYFNKITKGGLPIKTLNIALAGTGVGKSLFMCHCAASNLSSGYNVLYITLEMSEEKIAERIDANLLNETIDMLSMLPKDAYERKVDRVKEKTTGKLIIKEYPTASAGSANFRHLLMN